VSCVAAANVRAAPTHQTAIKVNISSIKHTYGAGSPNGWARPLLWLLARPDTPDNSSSILNLVLYLVDVYSKQYSQQDGPGVSHKAFLRFHSCLRLHIARLLAHSFTYTVKRLPTSHNTCVRAPCGCPDHTPKDIHTTPCLTEAKPELLKQKKVNAEHAHCLFRVLACNG
jgi:hypothetical protein